MEREMSKHLHDIFANPHDQFAGVCENNWNYN